MDSNGVSSNIQIQSFHGIRLLFIREIVIKIVSFMGQLILFRILIPSTFGIFAILSFIITFFDLFTDIGLSTALIQKKDSITRKEIISSFLIKQCLSLIVFLFIVLFSSSIISFYPNLGNNGSLMLQIYATIFLIRPTRTLLISLLERELKYYAISVIDILSNVTYLSLTVLFALNGFFAWSFIFGTLASEAVGLIIAFLYLKPSKVYISEIRLSSVSKLISFGAFFQAQSITIFLHNSLSPIIIGKFLGPYSLGILNWGQTVATTAKDVTDNIGRVGFAGFSRIQHDPYQIRELMTYYMEFVSIFAFFFTALLIGLAQDLIHFIFTVKWLPGLSVLYILAIANCINMLLTPLVPAILAKGKAQKMFYITLIFTLLEWILVIITIKSFALQSVPIASTIIAVLAFFSYHYILEDKIQFSRNLKIIVPQLILFSFILAFAFFLNILLPMSIIFFAAKCIILSVLYVVCIYIFFNKFFLNIIETLKILFIFK